MKQEYKKPIINEGDFHNVIEEAMKENRHVDYLKKVLQDYEIYKQFFETVFTDKNSPDDLYHFRANYLSKRPVWRDIVILGSQIFADLAEAIVYGMDWENDHMHGFGLPKDMTKKNWMFFTTTNVFYAPGWEDDPHPTYKSDQIRIADINYTLFPKMQFVFDFGDGHLFDIVLKEVTKPFEKESEKNFPMLVDLRGVAPEQYPDLDMKFVDGSDDEIIDDNCLACLDPKGELNLVERLKEPKLKKKRIIN